jgi:hypothetical protein
MTSIYTEINKDINKKTILDNFLDDKNIDKIIDKNTDKNIDKHVVEIIDENIDNILDNLLNNTLFNLENFIDILNSINNINEFNTIYTKIKKYEKNIIKLNNTLKKINTAKDSLNIVINNYVLKKINKKNICELNYEKKSKNNKHINKKINIIYKNVTNDNKFNNIDFVKFPVINISINDLDIIENTPIYYIQETQQYCIKINNNIIKGNIGNIYFKKDNSSKINKCKYNNCDEYFYEKKCKYFHNNISRNFTNYSWNHINKNKIGKINTHQNINNYDLDNSRFIGSLDTLMDDLPFSSENEKDLRNNQLIHDILLYMILSEYLNI